MNWSDLVAGLTLIVSWVAIAFLWVLIIAMRKQAKQYGREMARVDWLIRTETTTVCHKGAWALVRAGVLVSVLPADPTQVSDLRAVIDATMESEHG